MQKKGNQLSRQRLGFRNFDDDRALCRIVASFHFNLSNIDSLFMLLHEIWGGSAFVVEMIFSRGSRFQVRASDRLYNSVAEEQGGAFVKAMPWDPYEIPIIS